MNEMSPATQRKSRVQLVMLVALFAAPIVAAFIMLNYVKQHGVGKTKNHGDLVVPARPLTDINFKTADGKTLKLSALHGKWVLVYINDNECDAVCTQALYGIRQSRAGQKGEHERIEMMYVSTNGLPAASLQTALKEHPLLHVVYQDNDKLSAWLEQFNLEGKEKALSADRVYIIDPLGNLMMSYDKGFDVRGLANDLIHLLKASQIG